jgi:selenium metabolism protein YedF
MSELVNAKGLACPEPVILTKKALTDHDDVTILVDNTTAVENVKRFGTASACAVEVTGEAGGIFRVHLKKQQSGRPPSDEIAECDVPEPRGRNAAGPTVFVIASASMGHGNDDLGAILMKAFIHTAVELDHGPDIMIFYNTGVTLVAVDSGVVDDLKALEEKGVKILVCGTCVNFFQLSGKVGAGTVSNMYDIAGTLSTAGRIVTP